MNYYREMYYRYLANKFHLQELLKGARPKDHFIVISNIQNKLAILQLKIELCDNRATKEGMKEFKIKNYQKLSA